MTIDLIEVSEEEVKQIKETGDNWFYSNLRRQLEFRTKTISVKGGERATVDLTKLGTNEKYMRKQKGYGTLAIIAEFQESYRSGQFGNMQFLPRKQWKGKTTIVRVHDSHITVVGTQ